MIDIRESTSTHDESTSYLAERRKSKLLSKHERSFRQHSKDFQLMDRLRDNYKTMSNLGFLESDVLQSNLG